MSPSKTVDPEAEDPVTAEYDVYLTPSQQQQLLLLQYPNRAPEKPYNDPSPHEIRLKPKSGHIEMDIPLLTNGNFNKYQALRWGSTLQSHADANADQDRGTYGIAGGLTSHFMLPAPSSASASGRRRGSATEEEARDHALADDLTNYADAEDAGKTMRSQTLGGQIVRHDGSGDEAGKPLYFVGAFRGSELHLSQIAGTAQLRPIFHHLDAEDTRDRFASRALTAEAEAAAGPSTRPEARPRIVHQSYKSGPAGGTGNPKGELEEQSANLTKALRDAAAERWVRCGWVEESEEVAGEVYGSRLFNSEAGSGRGRGAVLKAGGGREEWLDGMTAPSLRGSVRRRKAEKKGPEADGEAEFDVG